MPSIHRSAIIDAPVQDVYEYWRNPVNWPEVWPSFVEVTDVVTTRDGPRTTLRGLYKLVGIPVRGDVVLECFPDQRIAYSSSGGMDSTIQWTFEPDGDQTLMTTDVEYTVPVPVLGRVLEPFVVKSLEHETEAVFANLKARLDRHA